MASALRLILETFIHAAFAHHFSPGSKLMLGDFIRTCRDKLGGNDELLSKADMDELNALVCWFAMQMAFIMTLTARGKTKPLTIRNFGILLKGC